MLSLCIGWLRRTKKVSMKSSLGYGIDFWKTQSLDTIYVLKVMVDACISNGILHCKKNEKSVSTLTTQNIRWSSVQDVWESDWSIFLRSWFLYSFIDKSWRLSKKTKYFHLWMFQEEMNNWCQSSYLLYIFRWFTKASVEIMFACKEITASPSKSVDLWREVT